MILMNMTLLIQTEQEQDQWVDISRNSIVTELFCFDVVHM